MLIGPLLSDAKPLKDGSKDLVGGDFAENGTEFADGLAEVLGQQFRGDAAGESVQVAAKCVSGMGEGFVVAEVGNHRAAQSGIRAKTQPGGVSQSGAQCLQSGPCPGGNGLNGARREA